MPNFMMNDVIEILHESQSASILLHSSLCSPPLCPLRSLRFDRNNISD